MDKIKLKVILGSTRDGRVGEKVAHWVMGQLSAIDGVDAELVDLAAFNLPFLHDSVHPVMRRGDYQDAAVNAWAAKIGDGDAFLILTPEYNHGYPGVLKNALDLIYHEWTNKPVGFVGYSAVSSGGVRAVGQLIQVVMNLKMVPVPAAVQIANLSQPGEADAAGLAKYEAGLKRTVNLMTQLARTLQVARTAEAAVA